MSDEGAEVRSPRMPRWDVRGCRGEMSEVAELRSPRTRAEVRCPTSGIGALYWPRRCQGKGHTGREVEHRFIQDDRQTIPSQGQSDQSSK